MPVDFNNLVNDPGDNSTGTLIDAAQFKALLMGTVVTSTSTGAVNNWAPGIAGNTLTLWNGAADGTFSGQTLGQAGLLHVVRNITTTKVAYFLHQSGLSSAGNKYTNAVTSGATPIGPGGWIAHRHDGTNWQLVGHEQGGWITPTFNAAHYTGGLALDSGDRVTGAYRLSGKTLTYGFTFSTATISTTPTALQIGNGAWGGFTIASTLSSPLATATDTGAAVEAYVLATAAATLLQILKKAGGTWTNNTNTTYLWAVVSFEVT